MSLQKQQDLLARLYTDPEFQSKFLADPVEFADDVGLSAAAAIDLAVSAADEVRWFSDSLITKRLREVVKMLPLSYEEVGAGKFEEAFRTFAATFSPSSVKKHLEDSLAFADCLINVQVDPLLKSLIRFESRRLRYNALGGKISFSLLRRDPRVPRSQGIGLWVAFGERSRVLFWPRRLA